MTQKIPQPPINRLTRPAEQHEFWTGGVVTLVGLLLFITGLRHLTGVETTDGNSAWETQVVKAFSTGGLRYAEEPTAPFPDLPGRPTDAVMAPGRPDKTVGEKGRTFGRVRIDISASTPCPT